MLQELACRSAAAQHPGVSPPGGPGALNGAVTEALGAHTTGTAGIPRRGDRALALRPGLHLCACRSPEGAQEGGGGVKEEGRDGYVLLDRVNV